jgi:SAM-dependent MidA family methyltransferase
VPVLPQRLRKRRRHVGEAAGLGERSHLGCNEEDSHHADYGRRRAVAATTSVAREYLSFNGTESSVVIADPIVPEVLRDRLIDHIAADGPLPFEVFMEAALYDPADGFFSSADLRSHKAGDFLTSPEVSPLFGETLARFVAGEHKRLGDPFTLVEAGAGSGSLLRPLLAAEPVEAWAVEVSPPARDELAGIVGPGRVVAALKDLPAPLRGVVVANELLDNLPMAIAQLEGGCWRERWVDVSDGELVFVDAAPRPEVAAWLERYAGPVDEGGWVEVQLAAGRWVVEALGSLSAGALVVVDYGDTAENLAPRRSDGTLRTYRAHHLGPHPLVEPGATDITADVNVTAVMAVAADAGASVTLWRQDDFLSHLGLREELSRLRRLELEAARAGDVMAQLKLRSRRTEAETLLHPRGLGDFRVVIAQV